LATCRVGGLSVGEIRRSRQSIKDNIVERYGRKRYKADIVKFLIYSYATQIEAKSQAEFIYIAINNGIKQPASWTYLV
jgi:four helix bundle protein